MGTAALAGGIPQPADRRPMHGPSRLLAYHVVPNSTPPPSTLMKIPVGAGGGNPEAFASALPQTLSSSPTNPRKEANAQVRAADHPQQQAPLATKRAAPTTVSDAEFRPRQRHAGQRKKHQGQNQVRGPGQCPLDFPEQGTHEAPLWDEALHPPVETRALNPAERLAAPS